MTTTTQPWTANPFDFRGTHIKRGTQIDQKDHYIFDQKRALCDPSDQFLYRYQGRYEASPDDWQRYKLNQCAGNEACDPALDEQVVSVENDPIPDVCRLLDGEPCSLDNECLEGHGCIDGFCGGAIQCNATIQAITEETYAT